MVLCLCPLKNNGFFFFIKKKRVYFVVYGFDLRLFALFGFCLQSLLWNLRDLGFEKPFVLAF